MRRIVGTRTVAVAAVLVCALAAAAATPQLLGTRISNALRTLGQADPRWLWLAGAAFALSLVGSAGCWRAAIGLCGGRTSLADATARYGAGSLVNTFVPARAGDAVRLGLFSRLIPGEARLWTTGSAFGVVAMVRAAVGSGLVIAGAAFGVVPIWPLLVVVALVAAGIVLAIRARRSHAHLLDAFRAVGEHPAAVLRLAAWVGLSVAARFAGATAVAAAVGIGRPAVAALLILPVLDVSGLVPLTPGNLGVASAAIAIAFRAHGVSFDHGLAAGITFQALETAVGLAIGLGSVLWLAPYATPGVRRLVLLSSAVTAAVGAGVLASLL